MGSTGLWFVAIALIATITTADSAEAQQGRIAYLFGAARSSGMKMDLMVVDIDNGNTVSLTNDREIAYTRGGTDNSYALAWSPDGRRIAFKVHDQIDVIGVEDGARQTLNTGAGGLPGDPAWSPDGTRIAFTRLDRDRDIFVVDVAGGEPVQLTDSPDRDAAPAWSPDGRKIAFWSGRDGNAEIYVMNADGSDQTRLTDSPEADMNPAWSPDGSRIAYGSGPSISTRRGTNIWVMAADGGNAVNLTGNPNTDTYNAAPTWSPDGTWIAYLYILGTRGQIRAIHVDSGDRIEVTPNTGTLSLFPSWSPATPFETLIEAVSWGRLKGDLR
ncbi:MAG: hypothetical protein GKR89_25940 [Candidatus Latescibacteria bacterium]|nr:hypothetical protein [Candidatus Latescibacterota bacterium]